MRPYLRLIIDALTKPRAQGDQLCDDKWLESPADAVGKNDKMVSDFLDLIDLIALHHACFTEKTVVEGRTAIQYEYGLGSVLVTETERSTGNTSGD